MLLFSAASFIDWRVGGDWANPIKEQRLTITLGLLWLAAFVKVIYW